MLDYVFFFCKYPCMSNGERCCASGNIFGLNDWTAWLDRAAREICGMSGTEFELAYGAGVLGNSGVVSDLGSVLPLIHELRRRAQVERG